MRDGLVRKAREEFYYRNFCVDNEAHFWLNGYVNKQNCRIWSEANPQVYVETPLHPEKLTVWCALWAGGIIGQYFFKNDEGHNVTVNGDRYRAMITNFFIPELNNHDVQELWFQQDGATCHTARGTIDLLKDTFGDCLISRFGPVNWPPRSCDLTQLDYFLWVYVKSLVYADKPQTLDHLKDNIRRVIADIQPQMLEKVIENWTSRLDYIRALFMALFCKAQHCSDTLSFASLECLFSALLCGVTYSLFSGQPLTLLGNTGPVLAFESMVFEMCERHALDYLSMRVLEIANEFPFKTKHSMFYPMCVCLSPSPNYSIVSESECQTLGGISAPDGCSYTPPMFVPNVFLMSVILFIGTFGLILLLREVKRTPFLTTKIRTCISDFAVMIAVIAMTVLDVFIGIKTPKLEVPQSFKPTWSDRDWLIPFFGSNPWWSAAVATLPALLLTMLIFMDQQITAVIVNRKENNLKYIPMPILYGVFLFMGVKSLKGLQFYDRILLMFMPEKYQPDYSYLRYVPISHVRIYTLLQLFLCSLLFACKLFKPTAFAFPVLLLAVIFLRKLLGRFFNKAHLKMLDDVMPEAVKEKDNSTASDKLLPDLSEVVCVSENDSKSTMKSKQNSHANINISEVLMQSSIWKCIDQQSQKTTKKILAVKSKKKKHRAQSSSKSEESRRLSVMEEDDEEYANSTDTPVSPLPYKSPSDSLTSDTPNGTHV
ncbi:sodium bicarbonate cotransporter 3 [Trichonephila clavipes]|nr:sodium bicarbonate cotransporter 3 [Trichonephila clavipes]